MKNTLKLVAAIAMTGFCFSASAQATKPMAKEGKMESKSEEKMESKKEEKMEMSKGSKMHHAGKMHSAKTVTKTKM